jgi:hypothetical protein
MLYDPLIVSNLSKDPMTIIINRNLNGIAFLLCTHH